MWYIGPLSQMEFGKSGYLHKEVMDPFMSNIYYIYNSKKKDLHTQTGSDWDAILVWLCKVLLLACLQPETYPTCSSLDGIQTVPGIPAKVRKSFKGQKTNVENCHFYNFILFLSGLGPGLRVLTPESQPEVDQKRVCWVCWKGTFFDICTFIAPNYHVSTPL